MGDITVTDADGEEHTIAVAGEIDDVEAAVEAHGFDLATCTVKGPEEYIVRRTTETDYQLVDPSGSVLLSTTYQTPPRVPEDIAEDIVTYAEANGSGAMHELRKMMLVGFRYIDAR